MPDKNLRHYTNKCWASHRSQV